ncbi:MAG: hypothetical protein ABW163_08320 [Luteimonas sp.]
MRSTLLAIAVCGMGAMGTVQASDTGEPATPSALDLVCEGHWWGGNSDGDARFYFKFDGESGAMQVPEDLRPPSRHWLPDGWINMEEIVMSATTITARAKFNFMADFRIKIDRMRGRIDLKGAYIRYEGICRSYDPETVRPAF